MILSPIPFRFSQIKRLLSRDSRDVLSFALFLLKRLPRSTIDRIQAYVGPFHRDTTPHPSRITDSKAPIMQFEPLYQFGRDFIDGGDILFLGADLDFKWPPDWRTGEIGKWPSGPSQLIQYYGVGNSLDIKPIWEVHRLQWLPSIACVASREGDEGLAKEVLDAIIEYSELHPMNRTLAWMEGIEVSLRAIAIVESLSWIRDLTGSDDRVSSIYRILSQHASWLNSHLSTKWRLNNNHLLMELIGLRILSERIHWHPKSGIWKSKSEKKLRKELADQISDGRNWEPTTAYHKLVTEGMLVLCHHLHSKNSEPTPSISHFQEVTGEMVCTLGKITGPSGKMPLVGDDDSGTVLPTYRDHCVTDNSIVLKLAESMGFAPIMNDRVTEYWQDQGMGVIRDNLDFVHFVSGAPEGKGRQGSHRHLDMLSVTVSLGGLDIILDGGTGQYFGNSRLRDLFRSEACHSGISSRGRPWADLRGPFEITNPPIGRFYRDENSIEISCNHPSGGSATRKIELSSGNVLITDSLKLIDPVIRYIVSAEGIEEIDDETWRMRWPDWIIEHTPVPKIVRTNYYDSRINPRLSSGYGRFEDCFILEFEHEVGVIAQTNIMRL